MKYPLIILSVFILLVSCANKKNDTNTETEDEVVETVQNVIKNIGNQEKGTLDIIDTYQELLLKQNGNKCGEWGGDIEEIRIYKPEHKGKVFADYKKTVVDCNDPYSQKSQPNIIEKKAIVLNKSELNLAVESITELINYKLTTEQRISHSGIGNYVISRDSTLIIQHWPSFKWPKFKELIKLIEKK